MRKAMDTVGIRELKAQLSHYLRRVRAGARLVVTERGRSIATITPVEIPADLDRAHQLIVLGRAQWGGGKPSGSNRRATLKGTRTASSIVLESRR